MSQVFLKKAVTTGKRFAQAALFSVPRTGCLVLPSENSNFLYSQALWEAGAQGSTLGDQSILPGSVLEPGFGVSPRAWMISTSSCPFRSCKPISTSPKPKCQNIQKTFKIIHPWVTKHLKNNLHVPPEQAVTNCMCLISSCITLEQLHSNSRPHFQKQTWLGAL